VLVKKKMEEVTEMGEKTEKRRTGKESSDNQGKGKKMVWVVWGGLH